MVKSVFFDLDGTLVDTLGNISHCANHIIGSYGYNTHNKEQYRKMVGNVARNLLSLALPDIAKDEFEEIFSAYLKYYEENGFINSHVYNGIPLLLQKLQSADIPIFVVSNKPHKATVAVISHFFGEISFIEVYGQQDCYPKKPDPYIIDMILEKYNLNREESVYIGDSEVDVLTGKNAKIKTIGCSYGFRDREVLESAKADYIVDSADKIYNILEQL